MKCKYCGNYNADGVFYCTICGNALTQPSEPQQTDTKLCAVCGKPSPKSSVFCGHCGKKFPSEVKHDDNNGTAPLYILDFVDKYIGDIMLGIASSGGVLRVYRDRVEYEITRTNMNGSVTGMMDGEFNNVPVSVGTIETYKYTEIQGCYVSNYLNSRPGILFILNNGVRFKFVCLFGAAEPTDVIRTINAYVDQARQMAQPVFMQPQYQQFYPQPIAYPQPPTPVQPNQDMQPQQYPQPIAYPQPPTPVQPNQDMQPQQYPQ
ncbi:MAG: zinc ribbon domain-containing protein, partial [Clostridia bacterium]|nr:zinc ribbon domain-containing protein [Clostridia bacterium]